MAPSGFQYQVVVFQRQCIASQNKLPLGTLVPIVTAFPFVLTERYFRNGSIDCRTLSTIHLIVIENTLEPHPVVASAFTAEYTSD